MKKAILLVVILLFALFYYGGIFTRDDTLPLTKEFFTAETPPPGERPLDLKGFAFLRAQGGEERLTPQAVKELDKVYQLQLDKGIRNLPVVSLLLIREARRERERRDFNGAGGLARYAIKFSPDMPYGYFELARIYWRQSPLKAHEALMEVFRGEMARFRYYPASLYFFYNLFYIVANALLLAFMTFGVVVMVKYLPLYFYDIRRNLSQDLAALLINSAKVLVLLAPFFLRLDILWSILYWSVLLWGYVAKKERSYIVLFLIVLVYFPFFLQTSSAFLDGPSSGLLEELNQANNEQWDRNLEQKLETWLVVHPNDADVYFTLGLIKKREGRFGEAEEYYRKAIRQAPQFSEAFSNLGNVLLTQKQIRPAITAYQQAIEFDPQRGAYYYNLYRAYSQETFLSSEVNKVFEKARKLDPKLIDHYSAMDPTHANRFVIDQVLTAPKLWTRFLTQYVGREGVLFRLFRAWFEKIPSRIPIMAPILFLGFVLGMARYARNRKFLTRCPMCGSPTFRFYLGSSEEEFICFNCHRIFVQKERLHPTIAERKSVQVREFQKQERSVSRLVSIVFPGFGDLWLGSTWKGIFLLFFFFIFVLRFCYWNGVMASFLVGPSLNLWRWIFWGGCFVVFYLACLRRTLRSTPRYEKTL